MKPQTRLLVIGWMILFAACSGGDSEVIRDPGPFLSIPKAPSELAGTVKGATQVDLSWKDNSEVEDEFRIQRKADGESTFSDIGITDRNLNQFSDLSALPNTNYTYLVLAKNVVGASGPSNELNLSTPAAAGGNPPPTPPPSSTPAAPSGLQVVASATTLNSVKLQWIDNSSNEDSFEVEVTSSGGIPPFPRPSANVTEVVVGNLWSDTVYSFRIRAANVVGASAYSGSVSVRTLAVPLQPPTAPSVLSVVSSATTDHSIKIQWSDNSNNEESFDVEVTPQGASAFVLSTGANSTSSANFIIDNLQASTNHSFRVRSVNSAGASNYTGSVSGQTSAAPPVPPGVPSNLSATTFSYKQINLSWVAPNPANQTSYELLRTGGAGDPTEINQIRPDLPQFSDQNLSENTAYCYRVRARNATGVSAYSNQACRTTPLAPRPSIPQGLRAQAVSDLEIDLTWNTTLNTDVFILERMGASGTWSIIADQIPGNVLNYSDATLSPGTSYSFRISARNQFGTAGPSSAVSATTNQPPATLPATPSGVSAMAVDAGHIHLSWSASVGASTYKIDRMIGNSGIWTAMTDDVLAPETSFDDFGLYATTTYSYRLRAHNSQGDSANSAVVSATTPAVTPPSAPQSVRKENFSSSLNSQKFECQYDIKWEHPASDPAGDNITYQVCHKYTIRHDLGGTTCVSIPAGTRLLHDSQNGELALESFTQKQYTVTAYKFGAQGASSSIKVNCSSTE